jgi:hypothetical protein
MPKGAGESPSSTVTMKPSTASCPWKKSEPVMNSTSFQELMDSDLAEKLQNEEDKKFAHEIK